MARVNHKLVKQRLNEKRSKITDKQFFTSRLFAGHFEDMAVAQTRRYGYNRRVRVNIVWETKSGFAAATDNYSIRINAGHPMVTKVRGRENRYYVLLGMFGHELGHVLFTDFLANQTYFNRMSKSKWFPYKPSLVTRTELSHEKELWDYVQEDERHLQMLLYIAHNIGNIIEDGYVENRMLSKFPGKFASGLFTLRDIHFKMIPTVTELIEKEDTDEMHIFESILQMLLSYAKFGEIKYGEEPLSDERIQTVFHLLGAVDDALVCHSGKERWNTVNYILIQCWDYIRDFCEVCKKRQEEAEAAGGTVSIAEILSEILQSIAGSTTEGTGSSTPVPIADAGEEATQTYEARAKTRADASKSESGDENTNYQAVTENGEKQQPTESEGGRIPLHHTDTVSNPSDGSFERNDNYERERYDSAASDIERILDKMAEKAACTELESGRIQELNEMAQNISYGNVHQGVHVCVNRIADVDEDLKEQYDLISAPLLAISKQLQKSIKKELEDSRRGGKQTGLIMGRRLDVHTLYRNDGKVFYKNNLPNEIPELVVGLLLDESGSMSSSDRCTYARAAAIIMHDFCESLEIPVMVYGHSTGEGAVQLFSYAEFEGFDRDDKYRLMDISARGANRDGAALRYVAEQLVNRPEPVKLLILVSDGQPAAYGYSGTAAEEDLRGIKLEYRRKGVVFVAAAIGDDKENIERIYGDSFLDITDLNTFPKKLTTVVKKYIRV